MHSQYIQSLPRGSRVVFLIRHAERYPIDDMKDALQIRLTEKGHNDSEELGSRLASLGDFEIFHSPVPRCTETAQMINQGILSTGTESSLSGESLELAGPYLKGDWMELVKRTRAVGPSLFLREWFDTDRHHDIMIPLEEAAEMSLTFLKDQLSTSKTSVINVSHDWNIMILREHFFNLRHEEIGMPDFLDGVILYAEGDKIHLAYHDYKLSL